ncbi:MAG: hypothetical protein SFV15_19030 [Polyangiaceae bacterium]|nr:hypothetical protein [Polyangiaceae bacterium]
MRMMGGAIASAFAIGTVSVSFGAQAAPVPGPVRIVARTGAESPTAGWKYRRITYAAAVKGGDVALAAQLEDANENVEQVIVLEGAQRSVLVSSTTPKPGGGAWSTTGIGAPNVRGTFMYWSTKEADTEWWGADIATGTATNTRRIYGENDQLNGRPIGITQPLFNSSGHVIVAAAGGLFSFNGAGVQRPVYQYLGAVSGLPTEWSATATGIGLPAFLDENGIITAQVKAERTVGANPKEERLFTVHGGIDGQLAELPWAQEYVVSGPNTYYGQGILHVGRGGAMVGLKRTDETATSTIREAYHSGDGTTMTQAFELVTVGSTTTPLALDGVEVTRVVEVRAIDNGSFAFVTALGNGTMPNLFVWSGGAAKRLAGVGMDAPGTGAKFDSVGRFIVNRRGQVLFAAKAGGKGVLYLAEPGQAPTLLAQEGMDLTLDDGRTVQITVDLETFLTEDALGDDGTITYQVGTSASPPEVVVLSRGDTAAPTADLQVTGILQNKDYQFNVKNLGPATANGATLTVRGQNPVLSLHMYILPRSGDLPQQDPGDVPCQSTPDEVVCTFGKLDPGAAAIFWFDLPTRTAMTLDATVYGPSDPNLANNTASLTYDPTTAPSNSSGCYATPAGPSPTSAAGSLIVLALASAWRRARRRPNA